MGIQTGNQPLVLDQDVVAATAVEHVDSRSTQEHVVVGVTQEHVVAGATQEHVVAGATACRELDRSAGQARSLDCVVAGQGVDGQPIVGRLGAGDVHLSGQAKGG